MGAYAKPCNQMALKDTQTLTCLLFIWFNLIEVSTCVAFSKRRRTHSAGSFNKNARVMESFDREDSNAKSGAQIGRLIIGENRSSNNKGDGDRLSSDVSSFDRPCNKNGSRSGNTGHFCVIILKFKIDRLTTHYSFLFNVLYFFTTLIVSLKTINKIYN